MCLVISSCVSPSAASILPTPGHSLNALSGPHPPLSPPRGVAGSGAGPDVSGPRLRTPGRYAWLSSTPTSTSAAWLEGARAARISWEIIDQLSG